MSQLKTQSIVREPRKLWTPESGAGDYTDGAKKSDLIRSFHKNRTSLNTVKVCPFVDQELQAHIIEPVARAVGKKYTLKYYHWHLG